MLWHPFTRRPRRSIENNAGDGGLCLARRRFITGGAAVTGLSLATAGLAKAAGGMPGMTGAHGHGATLDVRGVDNATAVNGFDPHALLTDWDTGVTSKDRQGRTVREFQVVAEERDIVIADGTVYQAWTYNGRVPGPSLRATEGDRIRVHFHNQASMPHTMHFHGLHDARVDGISGVGEPGPGETFVYEFDAEPMGCHLYHCHSMPLRPHVGRGLYGLWVVDPDPARHPEHAAVARSRLYGTPENREWQELAMVMNAFDLDDDGENEVYAANTVAFCYMDKPIVVERSRPLRIYLANLVEGDPINSFHLHANFFDYFDHGTTLEPTLSCVDTVTQCQGQRGILEMSFARNSTGSYMFHAHQSEFAELGWMSFFEVA